MLAACRISGALITQIPADEEPFCGNAAVYAIIIIIIDIVVIDIKLFDTKTYKLKCPLHTYRPQCLSWSQS